MKDNWEYEPDIYIPMESVYSKVSDGDRVAKARVVVGVDCYFNPRVWPPFKYTKTLEYEDVYICKDGNGGFRLDLSEARINGTPYIQGADPEPLVLRNILKGYEHRLEIGLIS